MIETWPNKNREIMEMKCVDRMRKDCQRAIFAGSMFLRECDMSNPIIFENKIILCYLYHHHDNKFKFVKSNTQNFKFVLINEALDVSKIKSLSIDFLKRLISWEVSFAKCPRFTNSAAH